MDEERPAAANKKRLVWLPIPDKCDEWLEKIYSSKSELEFFRVLGEAHKAGGVVILGVTDKDPRDILACAQEFGDFKMIVDDRKYPHEDEE